MCVCLHIVNGGGGTFSLSLLSCWRRLAGSWLLSARCVLVCSHPIVWNPNLETFGNNAFTLKGSAFANLYLYINVCKSVYVCLCVCMCAYCECRGKSLFFIFVILLASFGWILGRVGPVCSRLIAPYCLEP